MRTVPRFVAFWFLATLAPVGVNDWAASAQDEAAVEWRPTRPAVRVAERAAKQGPRAILIRNAAPDPGAPPYALVDQYGEVQRYVEPTPGVDLERYVGEQVRVRHDTGETLLATQLDLPDDLAPIRRESEPAEFRPAEGVSRLERDADLGEIEPVQFHAGRRRLSEAPIYLAQLENQPTPAGEDIAPPVEAETLPPITDSPIETYSGPIESYRSEVVTHDPDCPHCREKHVEAKASACDCEVCQKRGAPIAPVTCKSCGGGGWCGPTCNPPSRRGVYGRAEYLVWWFDGMNTPPLVTSNTNPNRPDFATPGTRTLYGGDLLDDARNGLRFTVGAWLDNERDFAIEADWLFFETESDFYSAGDVAGGGTVVIGRPFYDISGVVNGVPTNPQQNAQIVTLPGVVGGTVDVSARSEFDSFGIRLRTGICCREVGGCGGCGGCGSCVGGGVGLASGSPTAVSRVDFIGGYRYANLEEALAFRESTTLFSTSQSLTLNESFTTENEFNGVDLGFLYEWESRRWAIELVSKIALGTTDQSVAIRGSTTSSGVTTDGGLLAQSTNIGSYSRDRFSVLPELSARLAYRITPRLRASVAYSLLYWSNVVRPGDQIDFSVDSRVIPPTVGDADTYRHPRFAFNETSIWAHGFNFGLDYQY